MISLNLQVEEMNINKNPSKDDFIHAFYRIPVYNRSFPDCSFSKWFNEVSSDFKWPTDN